MTQPATPKFKTPFLTKPPSIAGRVPPHDLDAEAAVLSALLLDKDALTAVLEILKPEHFYSEANARVYQAAQQLALKATPVDMISVASWLRDREWLQKIGGTAYLAMLADATPAVGHVKAHAKVVYEKWRLRQLIGTCQRVSAEGYADVGEVQQFIEGAEQSIRDLSGGGKEIQAERIGSIAKRVWKRLDEENCNPPPEEAEPKPGDPPVVKEEKILTGIEPLDRILGPLRPCLMVVAAWSGVGKTSLMRSFAIGMAWRRIKKRGVIIFSLEMSKDEMVEAMMYSMAKVDSAKLDAGETLNLDEWDRLAAIVAYMQDFAIWIEDQETLIGKTPLQMEARARTIQREAAKEGVEIAATMVDYLQLADGKEGVEKGANREREISNIAYGFQAMSQRLGHVVIAMSQLNEDGKKRKDGRPCAEDVRESKAINQAAAKIVLLHNEHYLARRRASQDGAVVKTPDREQVEIMIDKNRGGRTGMIRVWFLPWCTVFEACSAAEVEE